MRAASFLTCLVFMLTLPAGSVPAFGQSVHLTRNEAINGIAVPVADVVLPEKLGTIQEIYRGADHAPFVFLIQDAHAIPDAQRSIRDLIQYFGEEYRTRLVALEGAEGSLDAQIFRSFPDQGLLAEVFEEYDRKGELAGGTAAAVFGDPQNIYYGIEDWDLYEQGLGYYLEAAGREAEIFERLDVMKSKLRAAKNGTYSQELLAFDRLVEDFYANRAQFLDVLEKASSIRAPAAGSELALLLEASQGQERSFDSLDAEVRRFAQMVQKLIKMAAPQTASPKMAELNAKYQEYNTSRITPQSFLLFLQETIEDFNLAVSVPEKLSRMAGNEKRMRDMQGTRLFHDFEKYLQDVKEGLFRNEEERQLDRANEKLRILENFARLELNVEHWMRVQAWVMRRSELSADEREVLSVMGPHFSFYENAAARDTVFFRNLLFFIKNERANSAVLVAGGFHAEGLTRQLRGKEISYALITPRIHGLPEENLYRAHMQGDVSWSNAFEVENGRINLYNAFVRGTRYKLLQLAADRNHGRAEFRSHSTLLKRWRDQIIRDLANQNRITDAGNYTRFIDEAVQTRRPGSLSPEDLFTRIEQFSEGLRRLEAAGQLTEHNIIGLLRPAAIPAGWNAPATVGAQRQSLPEAFRQGRPAARQIPRSRSELRANEAGTVYDMVASLVDRQAEGLGLNSAARNSLRVMLRSPYLDVRLEGIKAIESFPADIAKEIIREVIRHSSGTDLFAAFAVAADLGVFKDEKELQQHYRFSYAGVYGYHGPVSVESKNGILTKAAAESIRRKIAENDEEFLTGAHGPLSLAALLVIQDNDPEHQLLQRAVAGEFFQAWRGENGILEQLLTDHYTPSNLFDRLAPEDLDDAVENRLAGRRSRMGGELLGILEAEDAAHAKELIELHFYHHSTDWDIPDLFRLARMDKLSQASVLKLRQQIARFRNYAQFSKFVVNNLSPGQKRVLRDKIAGQPGFLEYEDLQALLAELGEFETPKAAFFPRDPHELERLMLQEFKEAAYDIGNDYTGLLFSYIGNADEASDNRLISMVHAVSTAKPSAQLPSQVIPVSRADATEEAERIQREIWGALMEQGLPGRNPAGPFVARQMMERPLPERHKMLFNIAVYPENFLMGYEDDNRPGHMADIRAEGLAYSDMKSEILLYFAHRMRHGLQIELDKQEQQTIQEALKGHLEAEQRRILAEAIESYLEALPETFLVAEEVASKIKLDLKGEIDEQGKAFLFSALALDEEKKANLLKDIRNKASFYEDEWLMMQYRLEGFTEAVREKTDALIRRHFGGNLKVDDLNDLFADALREDPLGFQRAAESAFSGENDGRGMSQVIRFPSSDYRIRVLSRLVSEKIQKDLTALISPEGEAPGPIRSELRAGGSHELFLRYGIEQIPEARKALWDFYLSDDQEVVDKARRYLVNIILNTIEHSDPAPGTVMELEHELRTEQEKRAMRAFRSFQREYAPENLSGFLRSRMYSEMGIAGTTVSLELSTLENPIRVRVDSLIVQQPQVWPGELFWRDEVSASQIEVPIIVIEVRRELGGEISTFIFDGHHRSITALRKKEKEIEAHKIIIRNLEPREVDEEADYPLWHIEKQGVKHIATLPMYVPLGEEEGHQKVIAANLPLRSPPQRSELRAGEWFRSYVPEGINLKEVREGLEAVHDDLYAIKYSLAGDFEWDEDDIDEWLPAESYFSEEVIKQYLDAVIRFNEMILNGPMDAEKLKDYFLEFHAELGKDELIRDAGRIMHAEHEGKIGEIFKHLFSRPFATKIGRDPLGAAAEIFTALVNVQGFRDGNKRASSFILNYILMKAGFEPFLLNKDNAAEYFNLVLPIREQEDVSARKFAEFLEENIRPRRSELRIAEGLPDQEAREAARQIVRALLARRSLSEEEQLRIARIVREYAGIMGGTAWFAGILESEGKALVEQIAGQETPEDTHEEKLESDKFLAFRMIEWLARNVKNSDGFLAIAFHAAGLEKLVQEAFSHISERGNLILLVSGETKLEVAGVRAVQAVGNLERLRHRASVQGALVSNPAIPVVQVAEADRKKDLSENRELYEIESERDRQNEPFGAFTDLLDTVARIAVAAASARHIQKVSDLEKEEIRKEIAAALLGFESFELLRRDFPDLDIEDLVRFKDGGKLSVNLTAMRLAAEERIRLEIARAA